MFGFSIHISISNGFGSALGKFATFCIFNTLNSNLIKTSDNKDLQSMQMQTFNATGFGHLVLFFKSEMSVRPIMAVSRPKN